MAAYDEDLGMGGSIEAEGFDEQTHRRTFDEPSRINLRQTECFLCGKGRICGLSANENLRTNIAQGCQCLYSRTLVFWRALLNEDERQNLREAPGGGFLLSTYSEKCGPPARLGATN